MAINPWKASEEINELCATILNKHHDVRLANISVVVVFDDTKAFVNNKINLGKVIKFSPFSKLWMKVKYDFCFSISMDLWETVLTTDQKEAFLDLLISRCSYEYMPETVVTNGKKKKVKDELGRTIYSQQIRYDEDGNAKLKILPLDLDVFAENIRRYGLWYDGLTDFKNAIVATSGSPA